MLRQFFLTIVVIAKALSLALALSFALSGCELLTSTQQISTQNPGEQQLNNPLDPLAVSPLQATALTGQGALLQASGGRPPYTWAILNGGAGTILPTGHFIAPSQATQTQIQITDVDGNNVVATVNTSNRTKLTTPNDSMFGALWGLQSLVSLLGFDSDIDALEGWFAGNIQNCSSMTIAVVDSGITLNHPDLATNLWVNPDEIPNNNLDDDQNGYVDDINGYDFVNDDKTPNDDNFHGTHVSGTIAAAGNNNTGVTGLCWVARVMSVKIADSLGNITSFDAALGIEYASDNGAFVSNHSWGGGGSDPTITAAVLAARNNGHLMVVAAGNGNPQTGIGFDADLPANLQILPGINADNIIAVASSREPTNQLSSFSNFGAQSIDVVAPGELIRSSFPTAVTPGLTDLAGDLGVNVNSLLNYFTISGTSMATPHVTGVAALIKSKFPNFTYTQVRDLILNRVEKIPQFLGKVSSGGRVDLYNVFGSYFTKPAILQIQTAIVIDPGNNGVQPNETVTMIPNVGNLGDAAANAATVTFASASTAIQLLSAPLASAGNVGAGKLSTSAQFSLRVVAGTPVNTQIPFTLTTQFTGGYSSMMSGSILVQ